MTGGGRPVLVCHFSATGEPYWEMRPSLEDAKMYLDGAVAYGEVGFVYQPRAKWSYRRAPVPPRCDCRNPAHPSGHVCRACREVGL